MKKPELLSPAGSFEKLKFALAHGADAVYAGLPMFSLRTRENRFDLDELKTSIDYAHTKGKKLYVTANIYAHNVKVQPFLDAMKKVIPLGADGYIMSDPGLMNLIKEEYPDLVIHLSTQANNTNWAQIKFWKKIGISRVILARELNFRELKEIREKNPEMELEAFIHGAMCMSYAGRCLLSDYSTGRPSNSGACAHDCRWEYNTYIEDISRPNEFMPIEEDEHGTYIMNSKDLSTVDLLPEILDLGLESLKIEGRNKSLLYVSTVTRVYREAIDTYFDRPEKFKSELPRWKSELEAINHRGYTHGFFTGLRKDTINYGNKGYATKRFAGKVLNQSSDNLWEVDIRHKISLGDEVEWMHPEMGIQKEKITKILGKKNEELETVSPGTLWKPKIYSQLNLDEWCLMRTVVMDEPMPDATP